LRLLAEVVAVTDLPRKAVIRLLGGTLAREPRCDTAARSRAETGLPRYG
jgi:hypothetical protein